MPTLGNRLGADFLFILHILVVFIILSGWYFSEISYLYISILFLTLASELLLGYCPLTRLEFILRKKIDPKLDYDSSFMSYYIYRATGYDIPGKYVKYPAIIFLVASLVVKVI